MNSARISVKGKEMVLNIQIMVKILVQNKFFLCNMLNNSSFAGEKTVN